MKSARNNILMSFEEKRLAKLLRKAALCHIRQEFSEGRAILEESIELLEWANRKDWSLGKDFVCHWQSAIKAGQKGQECTTAPAAWIHLAQELASLLSSNGDWIGYLGRRWSVTPLSLPFRKRLAYGVVAVLALSVGASIVGVTAHDLMTNGELTLFCLARVAAAILMIDQGVRWAVKAGLNDEEAFDVIFLSAPGGLAILTPAQTSFADPESKI